MLSFWVGVGAGVMFVIVIEFVVWAITKDEGKK